MAGKAPESFDVAVLNRGGYYGAVEQQYFFVSCSLQDMMGIMRVQHIPLERFHERFAIQLNNSHPVIVELMCLCFFDYGLGFDRA